MGRHIRKILLVTACIFALPIAFIAYLPYSLARGGTYDRHQSDSELIQNFNDHRAEFERLRVLTTTGNEKLQFLDEDKVWPADVDAAKINEYRQLLNTNGIRRGLIRDDSHVEFLSSSNGWGPSGSTKGYVLLVGKLAPTKQVESLDRLTNMREGTYYLLPIGDGWYLYYVTR